MVFGREVLKYDFGEKWMNLGWGELWILWIFKVAFKLWEYDYIIVLWVLLVQLWWSLEFLGVLERSIEKWFCWKMIDHRMGRNFSFGNISKVALRWWECDYVIELWVLMVELWRSLEFCGVLERSIEKWFWWKMNEPGVGRAFNLMDFSKLPSSCGNMTIW